jgi:hypothetical protein
MGLPPAKYGIPPNMKKKLACCVEKETPVGLVDQFHASRRCRKTGN